MAKKPDPDYQSSKVPKRKLGDTQEVRGTTQRDPGSEAPKGAEDFLRYNLLKKNDLLFKGEKATIPRRRIRPDPHQDSSLQTKVQR